MSNLAKELFRALLASRLGRVDTYTIEAGHTQSYTVVEVFLGKSFAKRIGFYFAVNDNNELTGIAWGVNRIRLPPEPHTVDKLVDLVKQHDTSCRDHDAAV